MKTFLPPLYTCRILTALLVGAALASELGAPAAQAAEDGKPTSKKPGAEKPAVSESKAALEASGLKASGSSLSLADEAALGKQLRAAAAQKKTLVDSEKEAQRIEAEIESVKQQITELKTKHVELSAALTTVSNAVENNQVVGALNAVRGKIDLLLDEQKSIGERLKTARAKSNDLREEFISQVMSMRVLADSVSQQWAKIAADPELQKAVEAENAAAGTKLKLAPSAGLAASEKKLQALEQTVLSEAIPLTFEQGGMWVDVVFGGKDRKKLIVDSGASAISLPFALAKELGIEPKSQDQKIVVSLADGSQVPATLKTIPSVRVGKFTVEDVECFVLDESAVRAPALLGMSFLGKFKFEVDKEKSVLRMVKFDSGEAKAKPKGSAAGKKKKQAG